MPDYARTDRMNHVADVFVDEFRGWAGSLRTHEAQLHLSGYVGTTLICVYEPWPHVAPGLLVGDIIDEEWNAEGPIEGLFTIPLVEMLEPRGTRNFQCPPQVDRSIIHWAQPLPFNEGLPQTREQLMSGVVPPGFVSRLPDPWPGPTPSPPPQPRPPLKTILTDLAEFAVVYSLFRMHRHRDD